MAPRPAATLLLAASLWASVSGAGVRYEGETIYSVRELDELLGVAPDVSFRTLRERLPALLDRLVAEGYLDATLTLRSIGESDHMLDVEPGPRARLGHRIGTGIPAPIEERVVDAWALEPGSPFSIGALERDLDRTAKVLAESGHPFAEVRVSDLTREEERVSFRLSVDAGARVMMDSLHVEGLVVTRQATVEHVAGFVAREHFRESERAAMRARLLRSGLFSRVGEVELRLLPRGGGVYALSLEEAPSTLVSAVVGVGGRSQELTGLVDVALMNLFGTARSFRALWEGRGAGRVYYEIGYREPWVLGFPVAIDGTFRQDQEDTLFTRTDWLVDVSYAVFDRLTLRAGQAFEESTTPLALLTRSTRRSTRFGLRWDGRESIIGARTGALVDVTATRGAQEERFIGRATIARDVTTLQSKSEVHVPLGRTTGFYAALTGFARQSRGEALRPENLHPFGGTGTIRGYEERRFRSGLGTAAALELRLFLDPDSGARVHAFYDAAYLDPARSLGTGGDPWKMGFGVGLRVPTRVGLVGIDLGAADEIASFAEARVHFSILGRY